MDQSDFKRPERRVEEDVRVTPDGHALPRVLDKSITMDVVQRYVETERARNRRTLLWIGTVFLFSVLFILVLFVGVGVFVLRNVRDSASEVNKAAEEVHVIRDQSASLAAEIVDVTNKLDDVAEIVGKLEAGSEDIKVEIESYQQNFSSSDTALKKDLRKFRDWIMFLNSKESKTVARLEAKIEALQGAARSRSNELAVVRKEYSDLAASGHNRITASQNEDGELVSAEDDTEQVAVNTDLPEEDLAPDMVADIFPDVDKIGPDVNGEPVGEISVVTFPNGDKYEGEFNDGFFNGWGVLNFRNGDKYEGEFKNDVMAGRGTFFFRNGSRYEGEYKDNMKQGRGRLLYKNGDRYGGDFRNDMVSGKGTMVYSNGNKYSGDFQKGLKHGNGIFSFENGDVYQGDFKEDMRDGRGKYLYANGAKYIGDFKEGRKHGSGRYIYPDGQEYRGLFRKGLKHGKGVCVYPNGNERKGVWEKDVFVRDVKP